MASTRSRGLRPGEYGVGVSVSLSSRTISGTAAGSPTSYSDSIFPYVIDRARRTVLLSNGAPLPPFTDEGRVQVYTTAFFGGGTTEANAVRIPVRSGETRSEVDITLPAVRGVRVSGVVRAPIVKGIIVSLTRRGETPVTNAPRIDATAADDGTFVFVAVPPGDYTLTAMRREPPLTEVTMAGGSPAVAWDDVIGRDPEVLWAEMPLGIGDADIDDLAVQLSPGILVTGSLLYEGTATRPSGRIAITLAQSSERHLFDDRYADVTPDGSFQIRLKPGRYHVLAPQSDAGPVFRTVIVNGIEIGDGPLVVGSEPLAERPARVRATGHLDPRNHFRSRRPARPARRGADLPCRSRELVQARGNAPGAARRPSSTARLPSPDCPRVTITPRPSRTRDRGCLTPTPKPRSRTPHGSRCGAARRSR